MSKSIPISVRIQDEDASFIAALQIEGAKTPSDKLRAIIREARIRSEGRRDYRSALMELRESLAPLETQMRSWDQQSGSSSVFVRDVMSWTLETMAGLQASSRQVKEDNEAFAIRLEAQLADRVFELMEGALRLGVTPECPCYQSDAVRVRLNSTLALAEVIQNQQAKIDDGQQNGEQQ